MDNFNKLIKHINNVVYLPNKLIITNLKKETHNLDYGACIFNLNNRSIRSRVAKITPKKIGQFVAFYEKNLIDNKNKAYRYDDFPEFLVINTFTSEKFGQFIFPKKVLKDKGILRTDTQNGKMAIRIYPIWDTPLSKQAIKTQQWQLLYFIDFSNIDKVDNRKILKLYSLD